MIGRLTLALGAVALAACSSAPQSPERVRVTIPPGLTVAAAAESLAAREVVASAALFRFYARLTGRQRTIQAGTYDLPRGAAYRHVLTAITTGRAVAFERLVVPEGLMLDEVAQAVEAQLGIPAESVLAAARDGARAARLGVPAASLDGYLYPSTYHVATNAGARDVVRQMVEEFERRWQPAWTARAESLGLTRHEVVILASIIEGEVRDTLEAPYVASVYHNRLRRGMRLQADPTVIYALGRRRRLFERDYLTPSPYNTYLIDGLPPGPIGQPSATSLRAALYPARTDFLFLVAGPDGRHIFSRTLDEHRRAVREVRDGG